MQISLEEIKLLTIGNKIDRLQSLMHLAKKVCELWSTNNKVRLSNSDSQCVLCTVLRLCSDYVALPAAEFYVNRPHDWTYSTGQLHIGLCPILVNFFYFKVFLDYCMS